MRVYISGVHSDADPSPGLGLARSLVDSFPDAMLVGVDYSVRSTGLHSAIFDSTEVQPEWSELNLNSYVSYMQTLLSDVETCWLSGLDVEIEWLANAVGHHPRLLIPTVDAQHAVRKPEIRIASDLRMRVPEWVPALSEPSAIHRLGRHAGWRLWVKGTYHEAYSATSFDDVMRQIERLQQHWKPSDIFIQAHVPGMERAYTFAAYQGRLLGIVQVEKRWLTAQGKTWAASIDEVPHDVRTTVQTAVNKLGWTGGGEIEFIRGTDNQDWLIDFNPRFPAYIHGVSLCGVNLPGLVVGAALKRQPRFSKRSGRQFVRVIEEIPAREDMPLPRLVAAGSQPLLGKHPSCQPQLAKRITRIVQSRTFPAAASPKEARTAEAAVAAAESVGQTPARVRDYSRFAASLESVARALEQCAPSPAVTPALSIKSDPHEKLGTLACHAGWWAEAISVEEVRWALRRGFQPSHVICNGPAITSLAKDLPSKLGVVFADSAEALETLIASDVADTVGLRLRLPSIRSRFGVDMSDYSRFLTAADCLSQIAPTRGYGVHFHFASDVCGPNRWFELLDEAVEWARAIADVVGAGPALLDMGGGWHREDFLEILLPSLSSLQAKIRRALPSVERVILEPGKAMLTCTAMLVSTVLEVRELDDDKWDVVVDASIADLPMAALYAHPAVLVGADRYSGWLTGGPSRILGGICMETDVLARGVAFPRVPAIGDKIVFLDAGGYDASMAWSFANGVSRDDRSR